MRHRKITAAAATWYNTGMTDLTFSQKIRHELDALEPDQVPASESRAITIAQPYIRQDRAGESIELSSNIPMPVLQKIARIFYLACGSMSEPSSAYHLSFSLHDRPAVDLLEQILRQFSIDPRHIARGSHWVVYLKDGQMIADFLLHTGAHHALLDFELLRVEKEMRNSVNRVVNCDSANTQRIANTAARQLAGIRMIEQTMGLHALPRELYEAAVCRQENPELSLKELGELMDPPLGKSGMNHRLKKIEQFAGEMLTRRLGQAPRQTVIPGAVTAKQKSGRPD